MPPQIPTSTNAQYYANGRGLARYQAQKPLAVDPAAGTPLWWSNEGVKDVWAGLPSRTGVETIWLEQGGSPRTVVGGPGAAANPWTPAAPPGPGPTAPAPTYPIRAAPAYKPRPGPTGPSYYIPPPPSPPPLPGTANVAVTYEIYGRLDGRQVPLWNELRFDGVSYHLKQGGRILIGHSSAEGYGFGGTPGRWTELYGTRSPADWGLDPDKAIVAFDGTRAYAVSAVKPGRPCRGCSRPRSEERR